MFVTVIDLIDRLNKYIENGQILESDKVLLGKEQEEADYILSPGDGSIIIKHDDGNF